MKNITNKKNNNFIFSLLVIVLFFTSTFYIIASIKMHVSSAESVTMVGKNSIDFGKSIEYKFNNTNDEYLAFNMSTNSTFEVEFYNKDEVNKIVVNSGEWATITNGESKPILQLIPNYITKNGYEKVVITPIRGEGIYFVEDFNTVAVEDIISYKNYNIIDFEIKQYEITTKAEDYQVILEDRRAGLELGVLHTDEDSIINAKIKADGENYSADIRLKGDWTDHLAGDQWSYRVELSGDYCIYGLQKFSLQPVSTRNGIWEYLIYEMYRENGGVALRYDFADVFVNGVYLGVFAVEEFMEKRVIENSLNREGPIIKYNETQMWQRWSFYNKLQAPYREYEVFSQNKTTQSENLNGYASYAITLINKFIYEDEPVENVFDVEKYINLYAILDLFTSYHGRAEHNMRHYYNPVTARLEPIPFDEGSNIGDILYTNNTDIYSAEQFLIYDILTESDEYKRLSTDKLIEFANDYGNFVDRYQEQVNNFVKTIQRDDENFIMDIWGIKPKLDQILSLQETTTPRIAVITKDEEDEIEETEIEETDEDEEDIDEDEETEEVEEIEVVKYNKTLTIINENLSGIKIHSLIFEGQEICSNIAIAKNSEFEIVIDDPNLMNKINLVQEFEIIYETSYTEQVEEIIKLEYIISEGD